MTTNTNWLHWLAVTITVLYYAVYPIYLALDLVLRALWYILVLLSSPFVSIGRVLGRISLIPWRIFARFEPVWYYLGCAILLGIILGLLLHYTMLAFVVLFDLDRKPTPKSIPSKGHDAISYRKAREAKKQKLEEQHRRALQARLIASQPLNQGVVKDVRKSSLASPSVSPLSPSISGPGRPGLLRETILEHSEEDDSESVF